MRWPIPPIYSLCTTTSFLPRGHKGHDPVHHHHHFKTIIVTFVIVITSNVWRMSAPFSSSSMVLTCDINLDFTRERMQCLILIFSILITCFQIIASNMENELPGDYYRGTVLFPASCISWNSLVMDAKENAGVCQFIAVIITTDTLFIFIIIIKIMDAK